MQSREKTWKTQNKLAQHENQPELVQTGESAEQKHFRPFIALIEKVSSVY
jgi:hypothetical protein